MIKKIIILGLIILVAVVFFKKPPFTSHRATYKEIHINPDSYNPKAHTAAKQAVLEKLADFKTYIFEKAKPTANWLARQSRDLLKIPLNFIKKKETQVHGAIDQIGSPVEKR